MPICGNMSVPLTSSICSVAVVVVIWVVESCGRPVLRRLCYCRQFSLFIPSVGGGSVFTETSIRAEPRRHEAMHGAAQRRAFARSSRSNEHTRGASAETSIRAKPAQTRAYARSSRRDEHTRCASCPHGKLKHHCATCAPCPHSQVKSGCGLCTRNTHCPHGNEKLRCLLWMSAREAKRATSVSQTR